jgi:hypothetical protein
MRFTGKRGTVGVHTQLSCHGGAIGADRKVDGDVKVDVYFYLLLVCRCPIFIQKLDVQEKGVGGVPRFILDIEGLLRLLKLSVFNA